MGLHTTIFPHSSFHTDDKETKDATAAGGSIGRDGCLCALWWKCPFPPNLSKPIPYTCYCKGKPLQVSGHKRKLCCTAGSTKTMPSCQESLRQSLKTNWSSMQYWAAFSSGFTQPPPNPKHICSLFSKVPRKGLFVAIYNGTVGWKMCFTRNEQAAWFCNAFAKFARFVRHHFVLGSTHASTLLQLDHLTRSRRRVDWQKKVETQVRPNCTALYTNWMWQNLI